MRDSLCRYASHMLLAPIISIYICCLILLILYYYTIHLFIFLSDLRLALLPGHHYGAVLPSGSEALHLWLPHLWRPLPCGFSPCRSDYFIYKFNFYCLFYMFGSALEANVPCCTIFYQMLWQGKEIGNGTPTLECVMWCK